MKPVVSVSCLAFNHAPYIRKTLDGFLMQKTTFPFEILIHDDCSTDGTSNIIREYEQRYPEIFFPIFEKENQYCKGLPIGTMIWNLPRARGKYIALCEGDDYWIDPFKLQKQVDFLESHPEYGMCYTKVERLSQVTGKISDCWGGPNTSFEQLLLKNTVPTLTTLIRADLYRQYIEEINPGNKSWKMGDYPLWLYISLKSKIFFIPEVSGIYRVLPESSSHSKSISKRYYFDKSYKSIAEYFIKRFRNQISRRVEKEFMIGKHSLLLTMGQIVRDEEEIKEARAFFKGKKKSLRLALLTLPGWLIRYPLKFKFYISGWKF